MRRKMQRLGGKGLTGSIQRVGDGFDFFTDQQAGQCGWTIAQGKCWETRLEGVGR